MRSTWIALLALALMAGCDDEAPAETGGEGRELLPDPEGAARDQPARRQAKSLARKARKDARRAGRGPGTEED